MKYKLINFNMAFCICHIHYNKITQKAQQDFKLNFKLYKCIFNWQKLVIVEYDDSNYDWTQKKSHMCGLFGYVVSD